jgi:DNA-binding MarR family transcriptional regulator
VSRNQQNGHQALAEFRYRIRLFLNGTDDAVRAAGLEPEQYQLILAVVGMPPGRAATIGAIAERLQVRHHTAVERIDRLERMHMLRRTHRTSDRREVVIEVTPAGHRKFASLARLRLKELRQSGPALVKSLDAVVRAARAHSTNFKKESGISKHV